MSEYGAEVVAVLALLAAADRGLGTRLLCRGRFVVLLALLSAGTLVFDGYLTARPVLHYGWRFLSGLQLGTIPVEDFGYGVALVTVAVMAWELLDRAEQRRR